MQKTMGRIWKWAFLSLAGLWSGILPAQLEILENFSVDDWAKYGVASYSVWSYAYEGKKPSQEGKPLLEVKLNKKFQPETFEFFVDSLSDGVSKIHYQYDAKGFPSRRIYFAPGDSLLSREVITCDSTGRILRRDIYKGSPTPASAIINFYHEESGKLQYEVELGPNGDTLSMRAFRYEHPDGLLSNVMLNDSLGDYIPERYLKYDNLGKITEEKWVNRKGEMVRTRAWRYDPNGYLVIFTDYKKQENKSFIWKIQYDHEGLPQIAQFLEGETPTRVLRFVFDR